MNDKLYTTQEVADLLKIDVQTVRRYIRDGKLKAIKIAANVQRIPEMNVRFLLDE